MLQLREQTGYGYLVGLAKKGAAQCAIGQVRLFTQFNYKANTWDKKLRVVAK
jgi:hypothetical protein